MNFLLSAAASGNLSLPLPRLTMKSSLCEGGSRRHNSFLPLSTGILPIPRRARARAMAMAMASSSSSKSSSCRFSSSSSDNLLLVRRFTENKTPYFSLFSTDKGEIVCDFHSSHFRGRYLEPMNIYSVNGLMLLRNTPHHSKSRRDRDKELEEEDYLWNPSTNEFKLLPPSPTRNNNNKRSSTIIHTIAFAFDSKSQDYKILRFVTNLDYDDYDYDEHLELYSLKNNSWKEILDYPYSCCPRFETHSYLHRTYHFYANGCCYWLTCHPDQFTSFDFATETFSFISIPAHKDDEPVDTNMADWNGGDRRLDGFFGFEGSLARILYAAAESTIELWVLNGGSWIKKFEIQREKRAVLWFSSDKQYLFNDYCSPDRDPRTCFELEVYHLPTKESKLFEFQNYTACFDNRVTVYPYTHTNLALNAGN